MKKKLSYREIKIREKAKVLSAEKDISLSAAISKVRNERNITDARLKSIGKKSQSSTRREAKIEKKSREASTREFGMKLTPGLTPFQGGAPSLGKKK